MFSRQQNVFGVPMAAVKTHLLGQIHVLYGLRAGVSPQRATRLESQWPMRRFGAIIASSRAGDSCEGGR